MSSVESFWEGASGESLRQGEMLPLCPVPIVQEKPIAEAPTQTVPISSPMNPADNREAMVVDFREIYSLPVEMLAQHALEVGQRWRLKSPYLEHFSQAFARFFMRVGLPSAIAPFK